MKKQFKELKEIIKHRLRDAKENLHHRHIKSTTMALLLAMPYLLLEWGARAYNLYIIYPPIDIFIHFFFGAAFASIALLIYEKRTKFILWWAFIISVVWEVIEIIGDKFPAGAVILDPFFYDGATDIIFTFAGAVVFLFILKGYLRKHYFR